MPNGKLPPTVTVLDVSKLDDLFVSKIKERDVVVAEPQLGLGRYTLHSTVAAMLIRHCLSTAKW